MDPLIPESETQEQETQQLSGTDPGGADLPADEPGVETAAGEGQPHDDQPADGDATAGDAAPAAQAAPAAPATPAVDEFDAVAARWAAPVEKPAEAPAPVAPPVDVAAIAERAARAAVEAARTAAPQSAAEPQAPEYETEDQRLARIASEAVSKAVEPLIAAERERERQAFQRQREETVRAYADARASAEIIKTDPQAAADFHEDVEAAIIRLRATIANTEGRERPVTADEVRAAVKKVDERYMRAYSRGFTRARVSRSAAPAPAGTAPVASGSERPRPAPAATDVRAPKPAARPRVARSLTELTDPGAARDRYRSALGPLN